MQADDQKILLTSSPTGGRALATIVEWRHRRGRAAHCLARAFRSAATGPVVILSEVSSNPEGRGISDDLPAVADAFLRVVPPEFPIDPADVTWIAHHGEFSYPDALDAPEVFTVASLRWTGDGYDEDLGQRRRLAGDELHAVLGPVELQPVPEVLGQLGKR